MKFEAVPMLCEVRDIDLNGWEEMVFSDPVAINPSRTLKRGELSPYVEMKTLTPAISRAH